MDLGSNASVGEAHNCRGDDNRGSEANACEAYINRGLGTDIGQLIKIPGLEVGGTAMNAWQQDADAKMISLEPDGGANRCIIRARKHMRDDAWNGVGVDIGTGVDETGGRLRFGMEYHHSKAILYHVICMETAHHRLEQGRVSERVFARVLVCVTGHGDTNWDTWLVLEW